MLEIIKMYLHTGYMYVNRLINLPKNFKFAFDKFEHFIVGVFLFLFFMASLVAYIKIVLMPTANIESFLWISVLGALSMLFVLTVATLKETFDKITGIGVAEGLDIVYTIAGASVIYIALLAYGVFIEYFI
jgi:hypothetical protein